MSDSELPQLKCEIQAKAGGDPLDSLTVGSEFIFSCSGLVAPDLKENLWFHYDDPAGSLKLKLLRLNKKDAASLELTVTGYQAGEFTNQKLLLTDGNRKYEIDGVQWQIQTVLKPEDKPEILPPNGPFDVNYPLWVWLLTAVVVISLLAIIFDKVRKHLQKRRLIVRALVGDLSERAATPMAEFGKSYRQLLRQIHTTPAGKSMSELDAAVRSYMLRKLMVPAFDWTTAEIISDLKKNHRAIYKAYSLEIKRLLLEIDRLRGSAVHERDVEQIMQQALAVIEKIDRVREDQNELR